MTVSTAAPDRVQYTGSGTVGPFPIPYYFLADADILAIKTEIATGTETELTLTTDYTLTGAGDRDAEGELTLVSALSSAYKLAIVLDPSQLQGVDYSDADRFPAETHEQALDKLTMLVRRAHDLVNRAFGLTDGATNGGTKLAPLDGYVLGWAGNVLSNVAAVGTLAVTAFGQSLVNAANAAAARTLLALGALATRDTVGSVQIDANAVTSAQIDDAAVTVAKLSDAAATGVKNYIINGGCQIAQTGSVTVTPADNVFIVGGTDMAASACTNRTSMAVNNAANTGMVSGYAHQITLTSSAAGVVNGAFRIEAADAVALNGKQITFACKGYQNSGGSLQARLRIRKPSALNDFTTLTTIGTGSDFAVADATVVSSSLTITLGASDATNGLQVEIEYTTAAAVTGKVFQIGDVRLVEGPTAPDMVLEDIATTLASCQRYLWRSQDGSASVVMLGSAQVTGGIGLRVAIPMPTTMRALPTVTQVGTVYAYDGTNQQAIDGGSYGTFTSTSVLGGDVTCSAGGFTLGRAATIYAGSGAGNYLLADARLK